MTENDHTHIVCIVNTTSHADIRAAMEKKSEEFRAHGSEIYWTKPAAE